jgi:hypothetical protein
MKPLLVRFGNLPWWAACLLGVALAPLFIGAVLLIAEVCR